MKNSRLINPIGLKKNHSKAEYLGESIMLGFKMSIPFGHEGFASPYQAVICHGVATSIMVDVQSTAACAILTERVL